MQKRWNYDGGKGFSIDNYTNKNLLILSDSRKISKTFCLLMKSRNGNNWKNAVCIIYFSLSSHVSVEAAQAGPIGDGRDSGGGQGAGLVSAVRHQPRLAADAADDCSRAGRKQGCISSWLRPRHLLRKTRRSPRRVRTSTTFATRDHIRFMFRHFITKRFFNYSWSTVVAPIRIKRV